jgi:protein-S-isoprenylcysteine O-methyltransferase Ste14
MIRVIRTLVLAALNLVLLAIPALVAHVSDRGAYLLFLICATTFCLAESCAADETTTRRDELLPFALQSSVATLAVFVSAMFDAASTPHRALALAAGVMLMLSGVALRVLAIRTLGPSFRSTLTLQSARVTRGIYAVMTHPSELGLIAINIGAAVLFRSVIALALCVFIVLPCSVLRMQRENHFLRHARPE